MKFLYVSFALFITKEIWDKQLLGIYKYTINE